MIWQARSRLIFANNAADADIVADELAKLTFDPMQIKDIRYTTKQRVAGHRKIWLKSEQTHEGESTTQSRSHNQSQSRSLSQAERGEGELMPMPVHGHSWGDSFGETQSEGKSLGFSQGRSQAMLPVYEDVKEVSNVVYGTFEEWALNWGRRIRTAKVGQAFVMRPGQPEPTFIQVAHNEPLVTPGSRERRERMLQENFESEFFLSSAEADRIAEGYRQELLSEKIVLTSRSVESSGTPPEERGKSDEDANPFVV